MVQVRLMRGKKTPNSKWCYFYGFKRNEKLMQVGQCFRTKSTAKKFAIKNFK